MVLADGDPGRAALLERCIVDYVAAVVNEDDPLATHVAFKHRNHPHRLVGGAPGGYRVQPRDGTRPV